MIKRRIEVYRAPHGKLYEANPIYYHVPTKTANVNRTNTVTLGDFAVQCTAGSSAACDAVSNADSTGSPGRLFLGVFAKIMDINGNVKDSNMILPEEEGLVQLVDIRNLFRISEDGVGGLVSDPYGHAAIIRGTIVMSKDTYHPDPAPDTRIDSSTISGGTNANRALHLQGIESDIQNFVPYAYKGPESALGVGNDTFDLVRSYVAKVNSAFMAPEFR